MLNLPLILAADTLERRLEFARLPSGWASVGLVVLTAVLILAVFHFYHREQRTGASTRLRFTLAGLRVLVILTIATIWLEPVLATYIHRRIDARTLVLVDGSASMGMRDRYLNPEERDRVLKALPPDAAADPAALTRAEVLAATLTRDNADTLRELAAANPVAIYHFGEQLNTLGTLEPRGLGSQTTAASRPASTAPADDDPALAAPGWRSRVAAALPDGILSTHEPATDISRAVRQAIEANPQSPIAAVVVFSDGRFNRGEPPDVVGRFARGRKIPIHVIGVGDPSPPRNVTISSVEAPPNVFVKDPFKITAHLRAQGLDGESFSVELLEQRQGSDLPTPVDAKQVTVGADGQIAPVVFSRQIGEAAEVRMIVRIPLQDGETLSDDNAREAAVRALENRMRVLLVAGGPGWDYRYLTRLLERDATVNLSCWLQSADEDAVREGNTVIDHFPRTREELFVYDCVILMDPQPGDFDPAWNNLIENMVGEFGSGLLFVAGRKNTPLFAHNDNITGLLNILPVSFEPGEADLLINEMGHFQNTAWPLAVPPAVLSHPVLSLSAEASENAAIWARLPGVYWHYPVRREKPVATALLRHSNPRMRNSYGGHVLLATQFYGAGRTGYLGFDTTWRWRRYGDTYFNRFWIQLLRHMVEGKLLSGQKRGLIQVEREEYNVGESVVVEARLLDPRFEPMTDSETRAFIAREGEPNRELILRKDPNRPGTGWYRGQFVPARMGVYGVQVSLPGDAGSPPVTLRTELRVGQSDLEYRRTELDRASLETLATQSAGGRYLGIDELDQLAALIPNQSVTLVLNGQPVTLWDHWWTLVLLVVLLGLEWAGRKRARLL